MGSTHPFRLNVRAVRSAFKIYTALLLDAFPLHEGTHLRFTPEKGHRIRNTLCSVLWIR
jgi:hypothetical protein